MAGFKAKTSCKKTRKKKDREGRVTNIEKLLNARLNLLSAKVINESIYNTGIPGKNEKKKN